MASGLIDHGYSCGPVSGQHRNDSKGLFHCTPHGQGLWRRAAVSAWQSTSEQLVARMASTVLPVGNRAGLQTLFMRYLRASTEEPELENLFGSSSQQLHDLQKKQTCFSHLTTSPSHTCRELMGPFNAESTKGEDGVDRTLLSPSHHLLLW